MAERYQFVDARGNSLSLAHLDDDICRKVLHIEPNPKEYCKEFLMLAFAVSNDIQPLTLLRNMGKLFSDENAQERDAFAAVLGYVIGRGITARPWRQFDFVSPN